MNNVTTLDFKYYLKMNNVTTNVILQNRLLMFELDFYFKISSFVNITLRLFKIGKDDL